MTSPDDPGPGRDSSHARARVREERRSSDADARIDREGGERDDSASDGKTSASGDDGLVTEMFFWMHAIRQWDDARYSGTRISCDKAAFVRKVQEAHSSGRAPLVDGYAPFCKHVFVPNSSAQRWATSRSRRRTRTC